MFLFNMSEWIREESQCCCCVSESAIDLMRPIKQPQTLVTLASGGWYSVCQIAGLINALIIRSINRTTSQSLFCILCICLYCSNNRWRGCISRLFSRQTSLTYTQSLVPIHSLSRPLSSSLAQLPFDEE